MKFQSDLFASIYCRFVFKQDTIDTGLPKGLKIKVDAVLTIILDLVNTCNNVFFTMSHTIALSVTNHLSSYTSVAVKLNRCDLLFFPLLWHSSGKLCIGLSDMEESS